MKRVYDPGTNKWLEWKDELPTELEALRCMSRWLRIRLQHEDLAKKYYGAILESYKDGRLTKEQVVAQIFTQLSADVDHSSLLSRLLSGKEPLPEPPPLEHSYPVYPED